MTEEIMDSEDRGAESSSHEEGEDENGGVFFREPQDDPDGLHAVLYNIKSQDEWHTHQEVNGLALSGFGNRLLVNGGRLGEPTRAANLNNTLTINYIT